CRGGLLRADRARAAEGAARVTPYQNLHGRFARIGALREALGILHWDAATNMPDGGAAGRADQLAALKVIVHEGLTDPAMPDLLAGAEGQNDLDEWQRANIAEMRRGIAHATAVPADLVAAFSKACSECEMVWRKARPASDFAAVLPALDKVLSLTREVAASKAAAFGELIAGLPGMIDDALTRQTARPAPLQPDGPFSIAAQRATGVDLMNRLGFDFEHGRLDV